MKCFYHPTLDAAGYCPSCGRPLCQGCLNAARAAGGCAECLGASAAPPAARSGPSIGAIAAIGCLVILLLTALLGVGGYIYYLRARGEVITQPPVVEEVPTGTQATGPSEGAVSDWADAEYAGYAWQVSDRNEDWTDVTILVGPPQSEWMGWVRVNWSSGAGRYEIVDQGDIEMGVPEETGGPPSTSSPPPEEIPEIYRPGEEVAKEAALGTVEQPDWVAKVAEHSGDYTSATVWVGPPQSEWVWVVRLRWDPTNTCYVADDVSAFEYPGVD